MGGGRDKRKKNRPNAAKPSGAAKTLAKTQKASEKAARRLESREDDIDAALAAIALEQARAKEPTVTVEEISEPPSRRLAASFVSYAGSGSGDTPSTAFARHPCILMLGGEWYDVEKDKVRVYGELYRYRTDKGTWARANFAGKDVAPMPRSSHQCVIHKHQMYVFGGEFTSPNQAKFHHFRDLWRLDLRELKWEQLPTAKHGPTGRSGHRCVQYKGYMIMFGGFFDNGKEVRYYDECWALHLESATWTLLSGGAGNAKLALAAGTGPAARSACQVFISEDTLYVYGGYHKEKASAAPSSSKSGGGRGNQGGDDEDDDDFLDIGRGVTHADMWSLDLKAALPSTEKGASKEEVASSSVVRWERIKRQGMAPGPRAGCAMVLHRTRAVHFGGVLDTEAKGGEVLISEFFNELYAFQLKTKRWFPLASDRTAEQEQVQREQRQEQMDAAGQPIRADEHAVRAATTIQSHYRGYAVRKAIHIYRIGGVTSELLYSPGCGLAPKRAVRPVGRCNAMLALQGNLLFLYGGMVEVRGKKGDDREVALDDFWVLDVAKLDGWRRLAKGTFTADDLRGCEGHEWDNDDDDDDDDDGGDSDSDDSDDSDDDDEPPMPVPLRGV